MPLRSRRLVTLKRTYIAIIIMNIFSVLYNLPFWFKFEMKDFNTRENGSYAVYKLPLWFQYEMEYFMIRRTEFSKTWFFEWFYSLVPDFIFYHALPLIIIFCGNIAILVSIRKFNQKRRDLQAVSVADVKDISVTKIILPIIGLHFLASLLMVI